MRGAISDGRPYRDSYRKSHFKTTSRSKAHQRLESGSIIDSPEIVATVVEVPIRQTVVVMRFEPQEGRVVEHYHAEVEKIVTANVSAAKG